MYDMKRSRYKLENIFALKICLTTFDKLVKKKSAILLNSKKKNHYINVREYPRGNTKWTIQRNWQHRVHKTKENKAQTVHNMCWTSLYVNKHK